STPTPCADARFARYAITGRATAPIGSARPKGTQPAVLALCRENPTIIRGLGHGGIMSRLHSVLCLGLVMALPLALGGCAGVLVVGGLAGAAGGGYAAAAQRGVDGVVNDWEVQNDIQKGLMKAQPGLEEGITTTVYQGRVLLTGRVANPEMKMT